MDNTIKLFGSTTKKNGGHFFEVEIFRRSNLVEELIKELEIGGWEVKIEGDNVIVRGKPLTNELREKIRRNKELIIKYQRNKRNKEVIEKFKRAFGDDIEILPPDTKPKTCYACGGSLFWTSKLNGRLICAKCHPPASPDITAGWRGKESVSQQDVTEREEVAQVNYQKPICRWCKAGKSLDCPDCKGGILDERNSKEKI